MDDEPASSDGLFMLKLLGLHDLSLQRKLMAIIMATTLLALLLAATAFVLYDYGAFRRGMTADLGTLAETLQTTTTNALVYNDTELAGQILSGLQMQPAIISAAVYDDEGTVFSDFQRGDQLPREQPAAWTGNGSTFEDAALVVHRELRLGDRTVGQLVIRSNLDEMGRRLRSYLTILALIVAGVGLIALFISARLQRAVSEPILDLAKAARQISLRQDYSVRATKQTEDEIGRLTDDFNDMLAQIQARDDELQVARDNAEQANRSKSVFLASMSHELRTPLTAIIGYSEILEDDATEMGLDDFLPDLDKIKSSGKHLLGLINSILDLSKVEANKMELYIESFDIDAMVQEVAATVVPLIERNGNQFERSVPADIPSATGDLTKTRQILFNLLSNASKFTERGSIRLSVETAQAFDIEWFVFRVIDSGIGMTDEQRERLFQPFSQADASTARNYGGTGLGLALCKRFCELMGGRIDVESTLGEGSTFTVWLPQVVAAPTPAEGSGFIPTPRIATDEWDKVTHRRRPAVELPPGARHVLVIDDDPAVHDLLQDTLENQGFRVSNAYAGGEGLELARDLRPDIITLDVKMPGMDGWEVLGTLKADSELASIPVIMISVNDDQQKGYAMGAEYLTKPIDRARLIALLEKYGGSGDRPICLVVDDDEAQRGLLRKVLEEQGWTVREAENGVAALRDVSSTAPHLILLDLIMPQLDGFGFLGQLRKHTLWREIPVVVLTAMDLGPEERQRLNGGVERILQKSAFDLDELKQEIESLAKSSLGT